MTGVVRAQSLAAAQRAIARAHAGLDPACPILALCSDKTVRAKQRINDRYRGDSVLDTDSLARWSKRLGRHVTGIRIVDRRHDLLLSVPHIRERVYSKDQGLGGSAYRNDEANRRVIRSAVIESDDGRGSNARPHAVGPEGFRKPEVGDPFRPWSSGPSAGLAAHTRM